MTTIIHKKLLEQNNGCHSKLLNRYIKSVEVMNKNTAIEYHFRLSNFEKFIFSQYEFSMDEFINYLLQSKLDPYEILSDYCIYLQDNHLHPSSLKNRVTTVKNFLEFNDVDISPRKFKLKVKFPKNIRRIREALDKNDITNILNSCSHIKLKTYVMLLASTGMRATEALSIRITDIDFESQPAKITIQGENTKTKVDRYVFLTRETVEQIKRWIDYKYRKRRICYKDEKTGKSIDEYRIPQKNVHDFLFSVKRPYKKNSTSTNHLKNFYNILLLQFQKTLDRNGMGSKEEGNRNNLSSNENKNRSIRRKITLHSFRRFVKTTISDLGYADYSEWFIGHSGSDYWRKKENEKAEIFQKIEPYLTFLNIQQLKRQGADLETKIEELQDINQTLSEKDKMKEDVIANLSDKLLVLSERLDAIERMKNK
jgi:integrase